jgi:hypothetical protein
MSQVRAMKKVTFLCVAVLGFLFVVGFYFIYDDHAGQQKMIALLNGDDKITITSFATKYQQRRLICSDRQILDYIQEAIRKHPAIMTNVGNFSYYGYFKFKSGGTFSGYMGIDTNGFSLSVSSLASEEGFMTHSVVLTQPVPEKIKLVFAFLYEPHQSAAGTVLVLEDGKPPRKEHDETLVSK